jgi:hypothetical protein
VRQFGFAARGFQRRRACPPKVVKVKAGLTTVSESVYKLTSIFTHISRNATNRLQLFKPEKPVPSFPQPDGNMTWAIDKRIDP